MSVALRGMGYYEERARSGRGYQTSRESGRQPALLSGSVSFLPALASVVLFQSERVL
jgi:hypothetical protein